MILNSSVSSKKAADKLLQSIEPKRISLNLTIAEVVEGTGICLNSYMAYKENDFSKLTFEKFMLIHDFFIQVERDPSYKKNIRVNSHARNKLTMRNLKIDPDLAMNATTGYEDDGDGDPIVD